MMNECTEFINQGDGSITEPHDFGIVEGAGFGGERELLTYVNNWRELQGWPPFAFNISLYYAAYHSSRFNREIQDVKLCGTTCDSRFKFNSLTEQIRYYGFHSGASLTQGGFWGPKRNPGYLRDNRKLSLIWNEHKGFLEIGIANVGGWWTFIISDENECKNLDPITEEIEPVPSEEIEPVPSEEAEPVPSTQEVPITTVGLVEECPDEGYGCSYYPAHLNEDEWEWDCVHGYESEYECKCTNEEDSCKVCF